MLTVSKLWANLIDGLDIETMHGRANLELRIETVLPVYVEARQMEHVRSQIEDRKRALYKALPLKYKLTR